VARRPGVPVVMEPLLLATWRGSLRREGVDGAIQCPFHHWALRLAPAPAPTSGAIDRTCRGGAGPVTGAAADLRHRGAATATSGVWYGSRCRSIRCRGPQAGRGPDGTTWISGWRTTPGPRCSGSWRTSTTRSTGARCTRLPVTRLRARGLRRRQGQPGVRGHGECGAWFGGSIEFKVSRYFGAMGMLANLIGLNMSRMYLIFDGYPGGCLMTVTLDNDEKYKLLQCVTPVDTPRERDARADRDPEARAVPGPGQLRALRPGRPSRRQGADVQLWNAMKPDGGGAFSRTTPWSSSTGVLQAVGGPAWPRTGDARGTRGARQRLRRCLPRAAWAERERNRPVWSLSTARGHREVPGRP